MSVTSILTFGCSASNAFTRFGTNTSSPSKIHRFSVTGACDPFDAWGWLGDPPLEHAARTTTTATSPTSSGRFLIPNPLAEYGVPCPQILLPRQPAPGRVRLSRDAGPRSGRRGGGDRPDALAARRIEEVEGRHIDGELDRLALLRTRLGADARHGAYLADRDVE